MKLLYLIFFFALFSPKVFSQTDGDTRIIVTNDRTGDDNYTEFGRKMLANGYSILKKDDTFLTLTVSPIKMHYTYGKFKTWRYLIITAVASDNNITISAQHKASGAGKRSTVFDADKPETVEAFRFISELADEFGVISYSK